MRDVIGAGNARCYIKLLNYVLSIDMVGPVLPTCLFVRWLRTTLTGSTLKCLIRHEHTCAPLEVLFVNTNHFNVPFDKDKTFTQVRLHVYR